MRHNDNDKSIQPTSQSATSLKAYKAPSLTSYGDVSVLTKGHGGWKNNDATFPVTTYNKSR